MKKIVILATIAAFALTGLTSLASAATINPVINNHVSAIGSRTIVAVDYDGYERKHYRKKRYYDEEEQHCVWKKVRHYDEYGDVYYERVQVCS